jgi:hypothetical protein
MTANSASGAIHSSSCIQKKQTISPARQRLVELLQELNFGRIENLIVRGGEPVLDPMPEIIREHKFEGDNGPRSEAYLADFALKQQHLDLLKLFDELGDVTLLILTCKHGLPFSCEIPA